MRPAPQKDTSWSLVPERARVCQSWAHWEFTAEKSGAPSTVSGITTSGTLCRSPEGHYPHCGHRIRCCSCTRKGLVPLTQMLLAQGQRLSWWVVVLGHADLTGATHLVNMLYGLILQDRAPVVWTLWPMELASRWKSHCPGMRCDSKDPATLESQFPAWRKLRQWDLPPSWIDMKGHPPRLCV